MVVKIGISTVIRLQKPLILLDFLTNPIRICVQKIREVFAPEGTRKDGPSEGRAQNSPVDCFVVRGRVQISKTASGRDVGLLISILRKMQTRPVAVPDIFVAADAASSAVDRCHSLRSLHLPQAALPLLPLPVRAAQGRQENGLPCHCAPRSFLTTASPTSPVVAVPPRSGVRTFFSVRISSIISIRRSAQCL